MKLLESIIAQSYLLKNRSNNEPPHTSVNRIWQNVMLWIQLLIDTYSWE